MWLVLCVTALCLSASAPQNEEDFPVFVWRQKYRAREVPNSLLAPFDGTNVEGADEAQWVLNQDLSFYVGHAPGRNDLHLRRTPDFAEWFQEWFKSREKTLNVRTPCLTGSRTRARLFATLERNLSARSGKHGSGISLGDEISLTPWGDPLDICESPTCTEAWKAWCQREGLKALEMVTTDEVRLELSNDNFQSLGAWLARRRFHQWVVLDLLEQLATRARRQSPDTPIGMLGLGGQTAFGGVAIERALDFIDFVEVYSVDNARELLFTNISERQTSWATIFMNEDESGSIAGANLRVWEHLLRGGDGLVLWSDKLLADQPAWHKRLSLSVEDLRRVRSNSPTLKSSLWGRPNGVALAHSADSIAFNWLKDALLDGPTWPNRLAGYQRTHGSRELAQRAWLRLLEDAGWLPGALSIDDVSKDSVERFPLLILSQVTVLDDVHIEQLDAYLAAGGQLLIDGDLARFDSLGSIRQESLADRFFEQYSDQIHPTPDRLLEYPSLRLRPGNARAEAMRVEIQSLIEPSLSRSLFQINGGVFPWLTESRALPDGGWLCMALPNASTPGQRALLDHLRVELQLQDELQVEWIHPRRTTGRVAQVPAGDALIFKLLPHDAESEGSTAK